MYVPNARKVPSVTCSAPRITIPTKYRLIQPIPHDRSMTEPNASLNRTAFKNPSRCSLVRTSKVSFVSSSAVKLLMIRIPDISSWINAFRLELFFRNACHFGCACTSMKNMPNTMNGVLISDAAASFGFLVNMMPTTAITVIMSGISVVTLLESTSFKELMSPMIRDRIFPVGLLSKKAKSSFWIWVYSCWRIVSRILLQTFAMIYIRIFIASTTNRFKMSAIPIRRNSPGILLFPIYRSIADSIMIGFSRLIATP